MASFDANAIGDRLQILIGGISIKRSLLAVTAVILAALITGCGSSGSKDQVPTGGEVSESTSAAAEAETTAAFENTSANTQAVSTTEAIMTGSNEEHDDAEGQLLQSASVDLNGDGDNEQVEVFQVSVSGGGNNTGNENTGEIEGRLRIKSGTTESQLTFWKKTAGMSGILTGLQFEDLDGDGAKDIFIIIPGNGASFSYSNYFIYSYKKDISYSFTSDNELVDFIDGFSFKYSKGNVLSLENTNYGFSADLTIEHDLDQKSSGEYMSEYEQRAWIEPVSVDISEESRLALARGADGAEEIKVPLPVFGLATVDMIGEIDLYFTVDKNFNPVLKRFEVMDFNGAVKVKVGNCDVKQE